MEPAAGPAAPRSAVHCQSDSAPTHLAGLARHSTPQCPMGWAAPAEGHGEKGESVAVLPPSTQGHRAEPPRIRLGSTAGNGRRSEPITWPRFSWCPEGHGLLNSELRDTGCEYRAWLCFQPPQPCAFPSTKSQVLWLKPSKTEEGWERTAHHSPRIVRVGLS